MFTSHRAVSRLRAVAIAVAAAVVTLTAAAPAHAEPSPSQVEKQLDQQWNQLEPTIEKYNQVHSQLQTSRAEQKKLATQLQPLQVRINVAMSGVSDMAGRAYMQGGNAGLRSMLLGGNPADLTDKLTYVDMMARSQHAQVADVITLRDKYAADKKKLDTITSSLAGRDAQLAAQKKNIQAQIDKLQKLRTAAFGPGGGATGNLKTGPCPATYTNDKGGKAAAKACSLIGKPYVFGAAGPDSYDCSGLTLVAWASVGVTLRHYTNWQWDDASPVSRADLKPGDLVFWFSDLHHMGIYVGNNTVVHAPHTGDYVRMAGMDDIGPIAGFRRPS